MSLSITLDKGEKIVYNLCVFCNGWCVQLFSTMCAEVSAPCWKEVFCIKKQTYTDKMITDLRHLIVTSAELYGDKPRYIFKDKKTRKDVNFSFNDFLRSMIIETGRGGDTVVE